MNGSQKSLLLYLNVEKWGGFPFKFGASFLPRKKQGGAQNSVSFYKRLSVDTCLLKLR